MNLNMQKVLIKVVRFAQHFVDIPDYKFDEVLSIFEYTLEIVNAQAPMANAYGNLIEIINVSFQKVFEKFGEPE